MVLIDPSGPWLRPFFEARGYDIEPNSPHLTLASEVMKRLIDRLNAAIEKAAAAYPNRAYYVDLTGTLAQKYGNADNYTGCGPTSCTPTRKVSICWRRRSQDS